MIKEVIFDIDDTMYAYTKYNPIGVDAMAAYVEEHLGYKREQFIEVYERKQNDTETRLGINNAASHSRHIWIQEMLEEWNAPLFPHIENLYEVYWNTILEICEPEPGLVECTKALAEKGIRIGVGSDMTTYVQYRKLRKVGVAPYINHIVTSQEAGVEKPHPFFMEMCIKKSGVKPEECLFVGDNIRKDVKGAIDAGMNAVWYNPHGLESELRAELPEDRFGEIQHFDELMGIICRLKK